MSDERLFHITDSGRLSPTGEIAHYSWFSLPVLRCVICGQEMDASDYDIVGAQDVDSGIFPLRIGPHGEAK